MESRRRPAQLLREGIGGLGDARTWSALGWVSLTLVTRLVWFPLALALVVTTLTLCVVGIGIPLTVAAMYAVSAMVALERRLVGIVADPVRARPPSRGSLLERFANPDRWREVTFALTAWIPTLIGFSALAVVWGAALYLLSMPLWGWAVDSLSWFEVVPLALAGAALLLGAPTVTRWVAGRLVHHTEISVGPDEVARLTRDLREVSENRAAILDAVRGERRRIERNLHDGVQQQLVALGIDLGMARSRIASDPEAAAELLDDAVRKTRASIGELRVIGRGLHPSILDDRGLDAALSAVVAEVPLPVRLRCDLPADPPPQVAEAAWFVVGEALANAMKHSDARAIAVDVVGDASRLGVTVHDDGNGGADPRGSGLSGLDARVRALGGSFEVVSPPGGPTTVSAVIPLGAALPGGTGGRR